MKYLVLLILSLKICLSFGQLDEQTSPSDSLQTKIKLSKVIVPISLISAGLLSTSSSFEKQLQTKIRNNVGHNFECKIDNYLQYAPIIELYTADILGVKSKNHWFDQTKNLLIANAITAGITHSLKRINKPRPNGAEHSFPSGHTSFAFTNASVLFHEFNKTAPLLAYSGFLFSSTTGVYRILNNKHWFSDVVVGAGIGILVTEIVYYFEPLKGFNPFINSKNLSFIPSISNKKIGFYFSKRF